MLKMKIINTIDSGKILIESVEQIDINRLIKQFKAEAKQSFIRSQINILGLELKLATSKTRYGLRLWFTCPNCNKRVGKLYIHPLTKAVACRVCNNLDYRCRRFKGMIEQKALLS